ncbi:hypothetical protein KC19_2G230400 [Ceratodon purpureus]|uniref:Uncharacterized protein n=1 Tax=Ceratodon purpureus TaxID=3225 RepID=A0A8T0IX15_CERPU|nr:hypothetical protein KC19_2G230400 [Ceratodon purpureus]
MLMLFGLLHSRCLALDFYIPPPWLKWVPCLAKASAPQWRACSSLDGVWGYLFSKPLYQQGIQVESVVATVFPEVRCHHPSVDCEVKHAGRMMSRGGRGWPASDVKSSGD